MKRRSKEQKNGLSDLAGRALGWSFINNTAARLGTLGIGITLARLLGPQAFGTYAVAYVALIAILSFNELGVSLAIVRWQGEPEEIAPTVSTISTLTSVILYAGFFFAAPAFAHAMGAPQATEVIRILGVNVVIDGLVAVPAALMQRYFRQDKKTIADQANNWLGAAVSVGLAAAHFGAMSLAIGRISGSLVAAVLFIIFSPQRLRFGFDRSRARALLRFGLPLAGASIIVFAVTNVDQLVVGHVLGATALGFYVLAFNLASWPVNMFSLPVRSVAPAVFSRLQHDRAAMRTSFVSVAGLLGGGTLPICLLLSGAASPLIRFVYGIHWAAAAPALAWLALLGALRIFFEFVYDFFVVLAKSRVVFTVQLVWLIALVPALIAGARLDGIAGAAIAEILVAACLVVPWYLIELSKVGIGPAALGARLWLPILVAGLVGAFAVAASREIPDAFAACAVSGVVALMAIGLLCYRMRPVIASLRPTLSTEDRLEPTAGTESVPAAAAPEESTDPRLGRVHRVHQADPAQQAASLKALLALSVPVPSTSELGGPLPTHREATGSLPIYRELMSQMEVDPGRRPNGNRPAERGGSERPERPPGPGRHAGPPRRGARGATSYSPDERDGDEIR
jgi:O-antigen/teichoic acid export membrane protein